MTGLRRVRWLATILALGCVTSGVLAAGHVSCARADGDPASDVLVDSSVFLASDSGASPQQKAQLQAQLRAAVQQGHPLRVAVIASSSDLGSIGALWRQPQTYSQFLGRELSLIYHGELLVVMPNGFGVSRDGRPIRSALQGLAPRRGELATATAQAITRLTGTPAGSAAPVAVVATSSSTSGLGWWLATGVGVLLIAAAWLVSLRVAPLRRRRHPGVPGAHG